MSLITIKRCRVARFWNKVNRMWRSRRAATPAPEKNLANPTTSTARKMGKSACPSVSTMGKLASGHAFSLIFVHFRAFFFIFLRFSRVFSHFRSVFFKNLQFSSVFQKNSLVFACFSGFPKKILSDEVVNRKKTGKYRKVPVVFRPKPALSERERCESGKFLSEMEKFRSFPERFRTRRAPFRENSGQNRAFSWSKPKNS